MAPSRLVAATFGLTGFAVAVVAGLAADNGSTRVLGAALVSMVVCHILGLGIGAVGERVVNEHLNVYRAARTGAAAGSEQAGVGAARSVKA
jgi:tetrahydromethanopterin S-methyltransferase subunit C